MGREQRDWIGHTAAPTSPPDAPATAGEQYSSYTLSDGTSIVSAASIHTSNAYEESCRISLVYVGATGGESEVCLEQGVVSRNAPFTLSNERKVVGPGFLRGYVINLDTTSFSFVVSITKQRRGMI